MTVYTTPGVYFRRPHPAPMLQERRTDIAGFVGVAQRGPVDRPTAIDSPAMFDEVFGGVIASGLLADAIHGFFANGGRRCWVVRILDRTAARRARFRVELGKGASRNRRNAFELIAVDHGAWANRMRVITQPAGAHRFHLTLRLADGGEEFWPNLSTRPDLEPNRPDPDYFLSRLNDSSDGRSLDAVGGEAALDGEGSGSEGSRLARVLNIDEVDLAEWNVTEGDARLIGFGNDGLDTLSATDFSDASDSQRGLGLLEQIDEVSMVAIPDLVWQPPAAVKERSPRIECNQCEVSEQGLASSFAPLRVGRIKEPMILPPPGARPVFTADQVRELQYALIQHCTRLMDRIAILDVFPFTANEEEAVAWARQFDTKYAALYYPWLRVANQRGERGDLRDMPPSGVVAGTYAHTSLGPGVHTPPANKRLAQVQDVVRVVGFSDHGDLNRNRVNVIKPQEGRGLRILGARTLSSDTEWRFVNVRRLVTMIEEAIEEQVQWVVFEPHNAEVRGDVERVIRGFLDGLWQRGMLDGATEQEAYTVTCDDTTNTEHDVSQGRLICEIGLNPPPPAEFIVITIGISNSSIVFREQGGDLG